MDTELEVRNRVQRAALRQHLDDDIERLGAILAGMTPGSEAHDQLRVWLAEMREQADGLHREAADDDARSSRFAYRLGIGVLVGSTLCLTVAIIAIALGEEPVWPNVVLAVLAVLFVLLGAGLTVAGRRRTR